MAGKGGGAWKVAYADFVTAMMAFFMVMWLTSQKPDVKQAVAEYFRNPAGKQIRGNPSSSVLPKKDSSGGKRTKSVGKEQNSSKTKMTTEGKRSNVGTIIQFEANSLVLSEEGKGRLKDLLPEILGKPQRIEIRGHAVSDASGNVDAIQESLIISYKRALAAWQYLVDSGVEPQRIRCSGSGGSEPRFVGQAVDPTANARVEVYILDESYEPPGGMMKRLVSTDNTPDPTPEQIEDAMRTATSFGSPPAAEPKPKH